VVPTTKIFTQSATSAKVVATRCAASRRAQLGPTIDARSVLGLGRLVPLVGLLRWASLAVGVFLLPTYPDPSGPRVIVALALVGANTIFRTIRPLRIYPATWKTEVLLVCDLLVSIVAITLTADWASPFILCPLPTVILAAYGWGYQQGVLAALLTTVTIGIADVFSGASGDTVRTGFFTSIVVVLAALIGGFTRQIWIDAEACERHSLDVANRMVVANDLLHALHDVVQTLPASLDLSEILVSTRDRLREVLDPSIVVVVVPDETVGGWTVALADGTSLPDHLDPFALPSLLERATRTQEVIVLTAAGVESVETCDAESYSALCSALWAQDRLVGVIAVEQHETQAFDTDDAALFGEFAASLALAVDNARWFARLRTLGAEAERARIARDLHDRLAQRLAYVGLELDRVALDRDDPELRELREVVRSVVRELRETLYELRTTVTEDAGLAQVIGPYVQRWSARTGIAATYRDASAGACLPIQVEQELWRILQESLTNVERHADASRVGVTWRIREGRARLEITDDGRGMAVADGGPGRYGLLGIRERADAVGARINLHSKPGAGTTITVELEAYP